MTTDAGISVMFKGSELVNFLAKPDMGLVGQKADGSLIAVPEDFWRKSVGFYIAQNQKKDK